MIDRSWFVYLKVRVLAKNSTKCRSVENGGDRVKPGRFFEARGWLKGGRAFRGKSGGWVNVSEC